MLHLQELNNPQREAAETTKGPLLIIAGAGAGKTKTITHRILHLIKSGIAPSQILAITFTNKAGKEMRDRVTKLLSEDGGLNFPVSSEEALSSKLRTISSPFVSTFHAMGVHIIKENSETLGLPKHFNIFDKGDSLRAIKDSLLKAGLDPKNFEPSKIQNVISREKGNCVTRESFESRANGYLEKIVASVWKYYDLYLKEEKALDFDDLLLKTAMLLKNSPSILEHYQNRWHYIHVDEYQDTNQVQYTITKLLAQKNRNICVVGDIDQNIYSWRGADIKNILNFEKDYPEAKIVMLEENYRSTKTILAVANRIIAKNKMRREKNLFTKNVDGEKIGLFEAYDEADEARFIAQKAKGLIESGTPPHEISVLYRANFQGRALEEAFLNEMVKYQVLGTRFFERKEVKDVVSYLKAALYPDSLSDLKRIINTPTRGLGKVTILKIFAGRESELPGSTGQKVSDFRKILEKIKNKAETAKLSETIRFIIVESGLEKSLDSNNPEDQERLENMKELVTFSIRYDVMEPNQAIEQFLTDVALASDQDELTKEGGGVKLMTVHASKGLEFDCVFIAGLEENLFPHTKMGQDHIDESAMEEERRLFYVAVTRARKKVYLSYASIRTIFGSRQVNIPSEFIFDVDEEHIEKEESFSGVRKVIRF